MEKQEKMATNPIYHQNGNHANGKSAQSPAFTVASNNGNNANNLHKSSSSHFMISNNNQMINGNGKMEPNMPTPNGYRVAPKIPTKAEIDYHLENFIMSRKIALNGGNELRIDDKNISLHLNNPFTTSPYAQQHQQQQQHPFQQKAFMQQQQFPNNLHFNETINETTLVASSTVDQSRPKRPHSIAVSSPINLNTSLNNDLNVATLTRRQKITTPNIITSGMMNKITTTAAGEQKNPQYCSPINFSQLNHVNGSSPSPGRMQAPFRSLKSEFSLYTPPSPVAVSEANVQQQKQPPNVPQRRSQSIPRQVMTQNFATSNGQPVSGVQTLNRPRSLDRYSNVNMRTTNSHSTPHSSQNINTMKQSITFHGQQMLNQACYQSDIYEEVGQHMKQQQMKKDRPTSFAYGTVPEQIYLENQLRMYQDQLKNITESMKKYQEQTRILNELKRQQTLERQVKSGVTTSKSVDSKLSQNLKLSSTSINAVADEVQTPSHQLRLFLDNIRNSIKEPSFENDVSDHETDVSEAKSDAVMKVVNKVEEKINGNQTKPNNVEPKTPSDQLRLFLDAIRHNQNIETHQRSDVPKPIPESNEENFEMKRSETFSQVTDNIKLLNQDLESFNDNSNVMSISKNMDQILDDFNRMASLLKTNNSVDYLQKCSDALKQTTEQIRQLNGNNYSSDDSSCSTTPGSIREAVQNLLSQPRNGFQIMDDRMSIFIDIMEQQDRFSQVITLRSLFCFNMTRRHTFSKSETYIRTPAQLHMCFSSYLEGMDN